MHCGGLGDLHICEYVIMISYNIVMLNIFSINKIKTVIIIGFI